VFNPNLFSMLLLKEKSQPVQVKPRPGLTLIAAHSLACWQNQNQASQDKELRSGRARQTGKALVPIDDSCGGWYAFAIASQSRLLIKVVPLLFAS
jgi:hypothetical protein